MTSISPTRLFNGAAATLAARAAHGHLRRIAASAAQTFRTGGVVTGWTIATATLTPALICAGWVVADALQPPSYNPVRQSVSVLAGHAAHDRWLMTSAIFAAGCCYLVTAAGLRGAPLVSRLLLVLAGTAGIGIAASPEPVRGSTPQHLAWTALGAVTIAVWPMFAALQRPVQRHERRLRAAPGHGSSLVINVAFLGLLGWTVVATRYGEMLGLAERVSTTIQSAWPLVIAVTLRRRAAHNGEGDQLLSHASRASTQTRSSEAAVGRLVPHPHTHSHSHSLIAQPCARLSTYTYRHADKPHEAMNIYRPDDARSQSRGTAQMHQPRCADRRRAYLNREGDDDDE